MNRSISAPKPQLRGSEYHQKRRLNKGLNSWPAGGFADQAQTQMMARYHFNLRDGEDYPDLVGTELNGLREARVEALKHAGEVLKDNAHGGPFDREWSMEVTDGNGLMLFQLQFVLTENPAAQSGG